MPKGQITTIRAPQGGDRPEPTLWCIIGRNASEGDVTRSRAERVGVVFTADGGRRYRVVDVQRDEINRLIAVGMFVGNEGKI